MNSLPVPHFKQIRIENTNRCGYRCVMCPRDKHTRKQGVMSLEDFALVLSRIGLFEGEVHLHGFGESLLDRALPAKVRLCKEKMPKALVGNYTTLGVPHPDSYFFDLIDSGIDVLLVSCYGYTRETYQAIHRRDAFEVVKKTLKPLQRSALTSIAPSISKLFPPVKTCVLP